MGAVKVVKSYPEIFGNYSDDLDEEKAWIAISSSISHGSQTQKISFSIHDKYTAVCKLFKLGLRDSAIEMANKVLKYAASQQHYSIAQQLCNLLVRHSHLFEDRASVVRYDVLYRSYTNIIELEYQSQMIYGDLLYKYERGLDFDELEIIRGLHFIKEKLPFESQIYHYYFFSCQLMIATEYEYEKHLMNAIDYFEDLYFKHSAYISCFVNKLIQYNLKEGHNVKAEALIIKYLQKCEVGSTPWFRYIKTACLLYLSMGLTQKANTHFNKAIQSNKYQDLSHDDKLEWTEIRFQISAMMSNSNRSQMN